MIRIDEYKNYVRKLKNIKVLFCDFLDILAITIISE